MRGEWPISRREYDELQPYFREISKYPLLTREEEVNVAKKMKQGDEHALETLINSNLRFVVSIAKQYQNRGVSLQDLIAEGNANLPKAAMRFDENRGYKFISYAVWWIRQAMEKAIVEQGDTIRHNLAQAGKNRRLQKLYNEYMSTHNGTPPDENYLLEVSGETKETVRAYFDSRKDIASLDVESHDEHSLLETISYSPTSLPSDNVYEVDRQKSLVTLLNYLKPREQVVLKLYFGLDDGEAQTLQQIGDELHLTRERVRQIKEEAFKKLRPLATRMGYSSDEC